jgi:hypothetical protein
LSDANISLFLPFYSSFEIETHQPWILNNHKSLLLPLIFLRKALIMSMLTRKLPHVAVIFAGKLLLFVALVAGP